MPPTSRVRSDPVRPQPGDGAASPVPALLDDVRPIAGAPEEPPREGRQPSDFALDAVPERRILVVEDVPELAFLLAENLKEVARHVAISEDGRAALAMVERDPVDLMVLDVMLPGMSGLEVCRAMRAAGMPTPILMLTAKSSELDRIVGLEFGADDYMVKPFSMLELLARVKAIFRRLDPARIARLPARDRRIVLGDLSIDAAARQVFRGDRPIGLTEKEFDLLYVFACNPGRVYTRAQLLDLVWGYGSGVYEYTVTSHINRLRAKIEADQASPQLIQTVWGIGYRLPADGA